MPKILQKLHQTERWVEVITWVAMILILIFVRFLPSNSLEQDTTYYLIGLILSVALLYHFLAYKFLTRKERLYIKGIADIVLISVLIHFARDLGQFFFALYFLPIAAATLSLNLFNGLLIATLASVFVAFEFILNSQGYDTLTASALGIWQIALLVFITIFIRFLAMQFRQEREARQEAEESFRLARAKMTESEEREKEFVALTSHQLFTPLSIIRGAVAVMKTGQLGKLTPKQKDYLDTIHENTKNMVKIVGELISISQIDNQKIPLHPEELDINQALSNVITELEQIAQKEKAKVKFSPIETPKAFADKEKTREIFINLIENAIKYSDQGTVEIITELGKDDLANYLVIAIKDNGIGIKENEKDKLFTKFFRSPRLKQRGTGLGLYIAKSLVKKQNGRIWYEPNQPKGSVFRVALPLAKRFD